MEKMVQCPHWKEYQSLNGWVMFCNIGVYGHKLTDEEARKCGCTPLQREKCMQLMINNIGFGLLPEICKEKTETVKKSTVLTVR